MSLYYSDGLNLKEIGAVLEVTESRACQLHGQALHASAGATDRLARSAAGVQIVNRRATRCQPRAHARWSAMDFLSITGLILALAAVLVGAVLKGAGVMALVSAAAFMIVVVGTIAAILIQTPWRVMRRAFGIFSWVLRPPTADGESLISKIVEWSNTARKQGLLGLESQIEREGDEFMRKVLQLVVDGSEPDSINSVMNVDLQSREHADLRRPPRSSRAWASTRRPSASSARCSG